MLRIAAQTRANSSGAPLQSAVKFVYEMASLEMSELRGHKHRCFPSMHPSVRILHWTLGSHRQDRASCNPDGVCRILGVGIHGTSSGERSEGQGSVANQSHLLDSLRYVCLFDFSYLPTLCKLSYLVF